MKIKVLMALVIIFSLLAPPAPAMAVETVAPVEPPMRPDAFPPAPGAQQDEHGRWYMPAGAQAALNAQQVGAQATGGPDDFGYTWTDAEPYNWIDASGGTNVSLTAGGSGAIALPFPFKFYENTYNSVYISQYGYLSFTSPASWQSQSPIPDANVPNNVIAPFWSLVDTIGYIRHLSGGTAPNRYFVVEWNTLGDLSTLDTYTFEAILHENGDIVFQYNSMEDGASPSHMCAAAGIEDSTGLDGLASLGFCGYPFNLDLEPENSLRFVRPAPSARVKALPFLQGQFGQPGAEKSFLVDVTNTGELGADTYNISVSSTWDAKVYNQSGTTEITNTGSLPQGATLTVLVKVITPINAVIGDDNKAAITFTSTNDNTRQRTVNVHTAVPARFAQAYQDWDVTNASLGLYAPGGRSQVSLGPIGGGFVGETAVLSLPNGQVFYAWNERVHNGTASFYDIWYAIVNPYTGVFVVPPARLTNNSAAITYTHNGYLALALTPNGRIGVSWIRGVVEGSGGYVSNILFAVLNTSGGVVKSPTNLTGNIPGSGSSYNEPTLSATSDNRFAIAWEKYVSATRAREVYYALYDSSGNQAVTPTRLYYGTPIDYEFPRLVTLNAAQTLLVWSAEGNLFYTTLTSAGVRGSMRQLTAGGWAYYPDGVQLPDGRVALGWVDYSGVVSVRFAVLDSAFNVSVAPVALANSLTTQPFVSVTTDTAGRIILTWLGGQNEQHLLYALANPDGTVLTQPMIFEQLGEYSWISPTGHGNAPFPLVTFTDVPTNHWAWRNIESIFAAGITTGCGGGNYCPGNPVTREQMAIFLMRGIKGAGYTPPAVGSSTGFNDVPVTHWAAPWIKQFGVEGITTGCGGGNYCPSHPVTREQMAIFLLRARHGPTYTPPAVGSSTGFNDVPVTHWAAAWIKQFAIEGITTGCGGGNYCPSNPVTRDQMAVFLQRTFNLPLP